MKTVCVYHSVDLDGWMSAAIVKHWHVEHVKVGKFTSLDSLEFIGYNYGQPIPDLSEYDRVIMCDISFPKEKMEKLYEDFKNNFIWIDHHVSAIKDNIHENFIIDGKDTSKFIFNGLRDTKFAACELTWKYFFPNEVMPEIVRLLGRYDCFGHKGTDEEETVLQFQYGARQCISNYEQAYEYLITVIDDGEYSKFSSKGSIVHSILARGNFIYQYLCTEANKTYKNGFEITLQEPFVGEWGSGKDNRKFICINKERFNPINFGIDYHADGYDGCACFHYANGMWNFSLYNDNDKVDCSVIAKRFGGGGHAGASGFRLNNEDFMKLIS